MAGADFDWLDSLTLGSLLKDDTLETQVIKDYIRENGLPEDVFFDGLNKLSDEEIRSQAEKVSFKGFDMNCIKKSFLEKAMKIYPHLKSRDSSQREEAFKSMMKDVNLMICFLVTRSNNISKVTDLTEGREEVTRVFSMWEIRSNMQISNRQTGLTLSRICYIYPEIFFKTQILTNNVYRFGKVEGLEPIYHNSLAPAFMPRTSWGVTQLKLWLRWAGAFNNQINSDKTSSQKNTSLRTTHMICRNQFQQGASASKRLEVLIETYHSLLETTTLKSYIPHSGLTISQIREEVKIEISQDQNLMTKIADRMNKVFQMFERVPSDSTLTQSILQQMTNPGNVNQGGGLLAGLGAIGNFFRYNPPASTPQAQIPQTNVQAPARPAPPQTSRQTAAKAPPSPKALSPGSPPAPSLAPQSGGNGGNGNRSNGSSGNGGNNGTTR